MASETVDPSGWFDRSARPRVEISGLDRAKFLHNLTTNDVKRLVGGAGQESFVTTPQGKVLAYLTLLAIETGSILLRTDLESIEGLLPHLRKYGVFDDVVIEDVTARTFEYHVVGPAVDSILGDPRHEKPLSHRMTERAGVAVRVVRESPTGRSGLTLIGPIEGAGAIQASFSEDVLPKRAGSTFDAWRIEAGTPVSGRDVSTSHLPQEVGRDSLAINFVKGCYLGQETVARLDALGHVNRIFRGMTFEGSTVPPVGTPLSFEGKAVGSVTSSGESEGWGGPVALAYVKVAQAVAGTKLVATIEGVGEVEGVVRDLPMLPSRGL